MALLVPHRTAHCKSMAEDTLPVWAQNLAVFDTETTGVDPEHDRIVTATVAVINSGGEVISQHSWLINPEHPIDPKATEVHGVTDERARTEGMDAKTGVQEILNSVLGYSIPVVAFNAVYDFSILRSECERHGIQFELPELIVDPHVLDKQFDKYRKGKRTLTATAETYGVPFEDAHDATADAVAAGRVLQAMLRRRPIAVTSNLMAAQTAWKRAQALSFQSYLRRQGDMSAYINPGWPLIERATSDHTSNGETK